MYGPNDTLDTDSYYEPSPELRFFEEGGVLFFDEDPDEQQYLDAGYYDDPAYYLSGPDPDLARDRMIEDERWNGVD